MKNISQDLTIAECAYLAGLVDGEGCINFYRTKSKSCSKGYTFVARLAISNSDVETLIELRERLGMGNVIKKPKQLGNRKDGYNLCLHARAVRQLLPLILPYLRIKKKQAEIVLGFLNRQRWGGWKRGLTQQEHDLREIESSALGKLNQRGIFNKL